MFLGLDGNFLRLLPNLKELVKCTTLEDAHNELVKSFKEECIVAHLLSELQTSLEKHWKKAIATSQAKNSRSLSESGQSFVFLAEISCHNIVSKFINDNGKAFILNNLSRLGRKVPKKAVQAEWESLDDGEKETILSDHCHYLIQELSKLLERGSREQSLHIKILDNLHDTIQNFIMAGVQLGDPDIQAMALQNVKEKLERISAFTLKTMREVNPHSERNLFLTSKMDYPEMKNLKATNKPKREANKIFQKIADILMGCSKRNPIAELERTLHLSPGSLRVPDELDALQWSRILLNVLYDPEFRHDNFGNSVISSDLKLPLQSISKHHLDMAKRQLFAYETSTARCNIDKIKSEVDDTIKVHFGDTANHLTASVNTKLFNELDELRSLNDLQNDIAPIFIIPSNLGSSDEIGNVYLENMKLKANRDDDCAVSDTADENVSAREVAGLEDCKTTIFYVVEPGCNLDQVRSNLTTKPPGGEISLRYVVLPEDGRDLGVTRSVIKILAEAMQLPYYWTINDDLEGMKEFDRNSLTWMRCSFARGLLHGQRVLQHNLSKAVNHYEYLQRIHDKDDFVNIFPETATEARTKVCLLMADVTTHSKLLQNISILHSEFTTEMMDADCNKDPEKEKKWLQATDKVIEKMKNYIFKDSYKRAAGVSVGTAGGLGFSLHRSSFFNGVLYCRETNRRLKTYKMVLHNTDALKGLNYLPDSALQDRSTLYKDYKVKDVGWEQSFLQALDFYGVSNYETLGIYLESK